MKKIVLLIMVVLMSGSLVACSSKGDGNSDKLSTEVNETEENNKKQKDDIIENGEDGSIKLNEDIENAIGESLEELITDDIVSVGDILETKKLVHGKRIAMMGEMVGAITGIKYEDCNVEIYQYKDNAPKQAELDGFDMTITFNATNGHYALLCEEASNCDELVKFFNSLKFK